MNFDKMERLYDLTVKVHEGEHLSYDENVEYKILIEALYRSGLKDADIEKALDFMYISRKTSKALRSLTK